MAQMFLFEDKNNKKCLPDGRDVDTPPVGDPDRNFLLPRSRAACLGINLETRKKGHTVIDDVVMVCWKAEVNYSAPSQQLVRRPA